jgi:hypothetical protein
MLALPEHKIAELAESLPELEKAMTYGLAQAIREGSAAGEQMVGGWTGPEGEMCALSAAVAALRARRMSFGMIARELGLSGPAAARKAVNIALRASPGVPTPEARQEALQELDALSRSAWDDVDDPGPLTTVSGKVVTDPETGLPYPDKGIRDKARRTAADINKERRKLLGLDAPRQSVSLSLGAADLEAWEAKLAAEVEDARRAPDARELPGADL